MNALQKIQSAGFDLSLNQRGNIFISPASKLTEKQRQYIISNKPGIVQELKLKTVPDIKTKIRIYNYKIKDRPNSLLRVIMPGTELQTARGILKDKFGDRLIMVAEYKPAKL